MGEQLQRTGNKNFLKRSTAAVLMSVSALALASCSSGDKTSATAPAETVTVTAPAPDHSMTSSPETKTSAPPSIETHPAKPRSFDLVLSDAVPQNQSYADAIPELSGVNATLDAMTINAFEKQSLKRRVAYREAIAPDAVIKKWAKQNGALPYTIPSENNTALQVANNYFDRIAFADNKMGIAEAAGAGTDPQINVDLAGKLLAAQYYDLTKTTNNNAYDDFKASLALDSHPMYAPDLQNQAVIAVKDQNSAKLGVTLDGVNYPAQEIAIHGEIWNQEHTQKKPFDQTYSFVFVDGDWVVRAHTMVDDPNWFGLAEGDLERNPADLTH